MIQNIVEESQLNEEFLRAALILELEKIRDNHNKSVIKTARAISIELDSFLYTEMKKHYKIDCKSGCFHCCIQDFTITVIEILLILEHILEWEQEQIDQAIINLENTVLRRKNKKKTFCGFLKDSVCSIYSVRPIACATYFSSDVAYCEKNHGYAKKLDNNNVTLDRTLYETINDFYCRYVSQMYNFNESLLILLKHKKIRKLTIQEILNVLERHFGNAK